MPRSAAAVEKFFQLSLLGLVASGFLAVAGSGYLDTATTLLTTAGLLLRAAMTVGWVRLNISDRAVTILTIAYIGFYPLDYQFLSRDFQDNIDAFEQLVYAIVWKDHQKATKLSAQCSSTKNL